MERSIEHCGGPARLDRLLAEAHGDLTRSRVQQLIRDGQARVDGEVVSDPSRKVRDGQAIGLSIPPPVAAERLDYPQPARQRFEEFRPGGIHEPLLGFGSFDARHRSGPDCHRPVDLF